MYWYATHDHIKQYMPTLKRFLITTNNDFLMNFYNFIIIISLTVICDEFIIFLAFFKSKTWSKLSARSNNILMLFNLKRWNALVWMDTSIMHDPTLYLIFKLNKLFLPVGHEQKVKSTTCTYVLAWEIYEFLNHVPFNIKIKCCSTYKLKP